MHTDDSTPPESTGQRLALTATVIGTIGIALAYASAFAPPPIATWGAWLMAVIMPLVMMAVMVLGAARTGRALGGLVWPMLLVLALVTGGFLLALSLPGETPDSPLWFGLPLRAAIVLYGVGVLPLFVLPLAYALTFDRLTLSDEDIARVRDARLNGDGPEGLRGERRE